MELNGNYWNSRYLTNQTGWDLGAASPPLIYLLEQIKNKNASVLIPGCGNAHEADYLLAQGFKNITLLDIAPAAVAAMQNRFKKHKEIKVICQDFFAHQVQYDYVVEQTFFCALSPALRSDYVRKMAELLLPKGQLIGVLFNKVFEKEGPPFGGNVLDYKALFNARFTAVFLPCTQSIPGREGHEVWIEATLK
jgi:SAM-dependent methyltransferase